MDGYHKISELVPSKTEWHICVKVLRFYPFFDVPKNGFGLVLADTEGTKIEAELYYGLSYHYCNVFRENDWKSISNFKVFDDSLHLNKAGSTNYKICFTMATVVKDAQARSSSLFFDFKPYNSLRELTFDTTRLVDVVGVIIKIEFSKKEPTPENLDGELLEFSIRNQDLSVITCCALGKRAIDIFDRYNRERRTPVVCVLRWWKVLNRFLEPGKVWIFSNSPVSSFHINSDLPEIEAMRMTFGFPSCAPAA